jgi:CBS-domain-containing membrane protein
MNTEKLVAIAGSYLRAALAAVIALYLAGENNPKNLLMAAIAAVAGPVLKALDPKETAFGRGSE